MFDTMAKYAHSHLAFRNITIAYDDKIILQDAHLCIDKGEYILITGPSGGGKSTLLRLATLLEEAHAGELFFCGKPYTEYNPVELRQRIGFIQQTPVVIEGSVRDNLLLPFSFAANKQRTAPTDAELQNWLDRFALEGVTLASKATQLSVGQQQRLCCIRSLLLKPELLLMDEPTSALDMESRHIVEDLTEALHHEGMTIIMVTHTGYEPKNSAFRHVVVQGGTLFDSTPA